MTDSTVRCWLVERSVGDRNLVTLVYATPDGRRYRRYERSAVSLRTGSPVTAAVTVDGDDLESTADEETVARYAAEAERTAERYDPDDPI
ncbi:hypothetical protein [Natrononativus amylolyticus]|uniref:hypothetical protein n=1 Tax=Natrononativus amylolyticus TaxID=2963434 RepID=UPI0020CB83A8|nr:hypothetical protein [Natrononativus amylolyticus]